jgi:glycosyltransferase involved in cell wall biosynthesis
MVSRVISNSPVELSELSLDQFKPVVLGRFPEKPSVSVLITCYNYGPYVGEAIESALNQSYEPEEIIVSDDGSSDNSCEVVEEYARRHPVVKLVRGIHGGMAMCLNNAFAASSGDVVCLLDADDVFLPGKLSAVIDGFRKHPDCGFLAHPALLIDHKRRRRGVFPLGSIPAGDCAGTAYRNAGILMGLPPTTNISLRREVAREIFPIPIEFTGYAEQMIHRLAPFRTRFCSVREPLAEWRQHGRNDQKATHISVARLDRELTIMSTLWQKQKAYLEQVNPGLAESLPTLQHSPLYRKLSYTRARLAGSSEAARLYAELFTWDLGGSKEKYFWRVSDYLPRPLFSKAVDLLMTQSLLKELITRLRQIAP